MGLVQLVALSWNKSARGGEGARVRSSVPNAFAVSAARLLGGGGELLLDGWHWGDQNGFAAPIRRDVQRAPLASGLRAGSVTLSADPLGLRVRYEYDPRSDGAPRRQYLDPATGKTRPVASEQIVRAGEWVRILTNGRTSDADTGTWWYQQTTVNVAWFEGPPDGGIFLARAPQAEIRQLAELW